MYGLVNKAIEQLICQEYGEEAWHAIRQKAGVHAVAFVGMNAYDDAITYNLVKAASEYLNVPSGQLLHRFGRYWTIYVAEEGYRELMDMFGNNLWTFIRNLDAMHARVALMFPELKPPSFRTEDINETTVRVHYYSSRPGLAPMVVGLLEGLGVRFKTPVQVDHTQAKDDGHDHDVFDVHSVQS